MFTMAAQFRLAPGWHIYWENPGESGLATAVKFELPPGFQSGPIAFPGPEKFESPGGITSYGYKDEVLISTTVTTPDTLTGRKFPIAIDASWLACRESCVKQSGKVTVELEAATASAPSQPVANVAWTNHRRALPRLLSEHAKAKTEWRSDRQSQVLVITIPGVKTIEYFPSRDEQIQISGQALMPDDQESRLYVTYKSTYPKVHAAGVIHVSDAPNPYYRIDLHSSKTP
jgi:thiol:disulfide interchange protein DsbD